MGSRHKWSLNTWGRSNKTVDKFSEQTCVFATVWLHRATWCVKVCAGPDQQSLRENKEERPAAVREDWTGPRASDAATEMKRLLFGT
jgi:hypothetical protein